MAPGVEARALLVGGKEQYGLDKRWKFSSRAPKGSLPYLDKDELTPQWHRIWELLSKAQHDSGVWEAALVVVILLQLCKERGTVGGCLPQAASHCYAASGSSTLPWKKAVGSREGSFAVQSLQPGGVW